VKSGRPEEKLALAAEHGSFEDEGWRVRRDGSGFWANDLITALRDPEGTLVGFGNVTHDVTERVLASEQFQVAIESAPTGMLMIDANEKIVLANVEIERLFGYARSELLGKSADMLVPEGLNAYFAEQFQGVGVAWVQGKAREFAGIRKDGSEVPLEIVLNPLRTSEGDFLLVSVVDITERKRSMDLLRLSIDAAPTAMIMVTELGLIALVNAQVQACQRIGERLALKALRDVPELARPPVHGADLAHEGRLLSVQSRLRPAPAERDLDRRTEGQRVVRLGQVAPGIRLQRPLERRLVEVRRQVHDRHVELRLDAQSGIDAVGVTLDADVHEQQLGLVLDGLGDGVVRRGSDPDHDMAQLLERLLQIERDEPFVLDDEDASRTSRGGRRSRELAPE